MHYDDIQKANGSHPFRHFFLSFCPGYYSRARLILGVRGIGYRLMSKPFQMTKHKPQCKPNYLHRICNIQLQSKKNPLMKSQETWTHVFFRIPKESVSKNKAGMHWCRVYYVAWQVIKRWPYGQQPWVEWFFLGINAFTEKFLSAKLFLPAVSLSVRQCSANEAV